jgi:hypothetical protein
LRVALRIVEVENPEGYIIDYYLIAEWTAEFNVNGSGFSGYVMQAVQCFVSLNAAFMQHTVSGNSLWFITLTVNGAAVKIGGGSKSRD